jgi:endonuclease G
MVQRSARLVPVLLLVALAGGDALAGAAATKGPAGAPRPARRATKATARVVAPVAPVAPTAPVAPAATPAAIKWNADAGKVAVPDPRFVSPYSKRSNLADVPTAEGTHWVFGTGRGPSGSAEAIALVREAYAVAREAARTGPQPDPAKAYNHLSDRVEVYTNRAGETAFTVRLDRPTGFEGGLGGARRGNPVVYRMRLQIDGDGKVVAASPMGVHSSSRARYGAPVKLPRAAFAAPPAHLPDGLPRAAYANTRLGPPSDPRADLGRPTDYLLVNEAGAVSSHNATTRAPNWVSWKLTAKDLGTQARSDDFRVDPKLPAALPQAAPEDFRGSGYDTGHVMPSGDRTARKRANSATFKTTNMLAEAPAANRGPNLHLEHYVNDMVEHHGMVAYQQAGPIFLEGDNPTIGSGVAVPVAKWRVTVLVPKGRSIGARARVIATIVPNGEGVALTTDGFGQYRTSVAAIERATGLRFFSGLSPAVAEALRGRVDREPIPAPSAPPFMTADEWRALEQADERVRRQRRTPQGIPATAARLAA